MMRERNMRCAVVNLTHRSVTVQEIKAKAYGTYATFVNGADAWLKEDANVVILSTGVLTGTGAPGTGMMSWSSMEGENVRTIFAEGRLGPYLKYAGIDALVLTGRSETPVVVRVDAGNVVILDAILDRHELKDVYLTDDTVLAVPEVEGVLEEDGYYIADNRISKNLKERGVAAIVVIGIGSLTVSDSALLKDTIIQMYQDLSLPLSVVQKRTDVPAVRFLAVAEGTGDKIAYNELLLEKEMLVYASLGINLKNRYDRVEQRNYILCLLKACLGSDSSEDELEELGRILAKAAGKGDEQA